MADIASTATLVSLVHPEQSVTYDFEAAEAITVGQAVYQLANGKVGVAGAAAAGKQQFRGLALKSVPAGSGVTVLKEGLVWGFAVSGLNADAPVFLSNTLGALGDTVGTMTVSAGRVLSIPEVGGPVKALYVCADWLRTWA